MILYDATEWQLNSELFDKMYKTFVKPDIELFPLHIKKNGMTMFHGIPKEEEHQQ